MNRESFLLTTGKLHICSTCYTLVYTIHSNLLEIKNTYLPSNYTWCRQFMWRHSLHLRQTKTHDNITIADFCRKYIKPHCFLACSSRQQLLKRYQHPVGPSRYCFRQAETYLTRMQQLYFMAQGPTGTSRGALEYTSLWIYLKQHDDVIEWKHFPRYWPFVREIHRVPGEFPTQRPVTRGFDVFFDRHPK